MTKLTKSLCVGAAAAALLRTRCGTEPVLLATHDREAIRLLGWPVIELEAL